MCYLLSYFSKVSCEVFILRCVGQRVSPWSPANSIRLLEPLLSTAVGRWWHSGGLGCLPSCCPGFDSRPMQPSLWASSGAQPVKNPPARAGGGDPGSIPCGCGRGMWSFAQTLEVTVRTLPPLRVRRAGSPRTGQDSVLPAMR